MAAATASPLQALLDECIAAAAENQRPSTIAQVLTVNPSNDANASPASTAATQSAGDGSSRASDVHEVDCLPILRAAAADLASGQLICRAQFALAEAMTALEITDAKMDSGMRSKGVLTLEEALEAGRIPKDESLSALQVLSIMDRLLQCLISWMSGQQLAQTVFTCLYLHQQLTLIRNPYLMIYAHCILRHVSQYRAMILAADVFHEEDFELNVNNFDLMEPWDEAALNKLIAAAEDELSLKIRRAKGSNNTDLQHVTPLQEDPALEVPYCEALLARLRLLKALSAAQIMVSKGKGPRKQQDAARKAVSAAKQLLAAVEASHSLVVVSAKDSSSATTTDDGAASTTSSAAEEQTHCPEGVFEPAIITRLRYPGTPKPSPVFSFSTAIAHLNRLLDDFALFIEVPLLYPSLPALLEYFAHFQRTDSYPLAIISRSQLILVIARQQQLFNGDPIPWVREQLSEFGVPAELLADPAAASFIEKCSKVLLCQFRTFCFNRGRQRRKLPDSLADWAILEHEASMLDDYFATLQPNHADAHHQHPPSRFFSYWVVEYTISFMTIYLNLGFELELYAPDEVAMTHNYLDFLLGRQIFFIRTRGLSLLQMQYEQRQKQLQEQAARNAGGAKAGGGKKKASAKAKAAKAKAAEAPPLGPPPLTPKQLLLELSQCMHRALFRYQTAIRKAQKDAGKTPIGETKFGSSEFRYARRFQAFQRVPQPQYLPYASFTEALQPINPKEEGPGFASVERIALSALDHFKYAKERAVELIKIAQASSTTPPNDATPTPFLFPADILAELKDITRVALSNIAQIEFWRRVNWEIGDKKQQLDFSVHPYFGIVSVK